jgi:hypothetical protein
MNDLDAVIFALLGSVMELLPMVFPSWFPRGGADQSSARALWLGVVGATQIAIGASYFVRAHAVPAAIRIFSAMPGADRDSLALQNPRAVAGR